MTNGQVIKKMKDDIKMFQNKICNNRKNIIK